MHLQVLIYFQRSTSCLNISINQLTSHYRPSDNTSLTEDTGKVPTDLPLIGLFVADTLPLSAPDTGAGALFAGLAIIGLVGVVVAGFIIVLAVTVMAVVVDIRKREVIPVDLALHPDAGAELAAYVVAYIIACVIACVIRTLKRLLIAFRPLGPFLLQTVLLRSSIDYSRVFQLGLELADLLEQDVLDLLLLGQLTLLLLQLTSHLLEQLRKMEGSLFLLLQLLDFLLVLFPVGFGV